MTRTRLFAIVLVAVLSLARSSQAAEWSLFGARPLDVYDSALRVGLGWPDVHVAYHLPILKELEVAPKLGFVWAPGGTTLGCCGFGNTVGAELRYLLYEEDDLHLGVRADTAILLYYPVGNANSTRVGTRISPGFIGDYSVNETLNVTFSFDMPVELYYTPAVEGIIPFQFGGGLEFIPKGPFMLWTQIHMGPSILASGDGSLVSLSLVGQIGIGLLL